jgi:hypothetical protein
MTRTITIMIALAAACTSQPKVQTCGGMSGHDDYTIATPADPPIQLRVDSCRVDVDACSDLCALAAQSSANVTKASPFGVNVTKCDVSFDPTHAYVHVEYATACTLFNGGAP